MATILPNCGFEPRIVLTRLRRAAKAEIDIHLPRVELLIARLDRFDAPYEDREDDDPAGDTLDEHGECPTDTGTDVLSLLPLYAVDQTKGPLNEVAAHRTWQRTGRDA